MPEALFRAKLQVTEVGQVGLEPTTAGLWARELSAATARCAPVGRFGSGWLPERHLEARECRWVKVGRSVAVFIQTSPLAKTAVTQRNSSKCELDDDGQDVCT